MCVKQHFFYECRKGCGEIFVTSPDIVENSEKALLTPPDIVANSEKAVTKLVPKTSKSAYDKAY
jgi:hypothetical protein